MSALLERNLSALLRRAYHPVRPRPAFARALREEILGGIGGSPGKRGGKRAGKSAGKTDRAPHRRPWIAAAAGLLILAALAALLRDLGSAPVQLPSHPDGILASGQVAWRSAPDGPWRPSSGLELALDPAAPYVEVKTPDGRGVTLRFVAQLAGTGAARPEARPEARLVVGPRSRIALRTGEGVLTLDHGAGSLALVGGLSARVTTSEGGLEISGGPLHLAYLDPRELHEGDLIPRPDPARPVLVVELPSGGARLYGLDGVPRTLGPGDHLLQAGRLLRPLLSGAEAAPRRDPAGTPAGPTRSGSQAPRAGVLVGRVLDGTTGRPVPRYTLWWRRSVELPQVARPRAEAVNDPDGAFRVEGVGPGRYRIVVEAPGYAVAQRTGIVVTAGGELRSELHLDRGGEVRGYVVDARTGAPLEGALVIAEFDVPQQAIDLLGEQVQAPPLASARTDANGAYRLPHVSFGRHHLRVSHPEYAPAWTASFRVQGSPNGERSGEHGAERSGEHGAERSGEHGAEQRADEVAVRTLPNVALDAGGRVRGRVARPDGSAWAGAQVVLSLVVMDRPQPVYTYGFASTGPDGTYVVEHLPAGYYVGMTLREDGESVSEEGVRQVTVGKGATTVLDFAPIPGATHLDGVLRDAAGAPLAGFKVSLAPELGDAAFGDWIATETDAQGRFDFDAVPPGRYDVYVSREFPSMTRRRVIDVPARPTHTMDLYLPRTVLTGRVRWANSGEPVCRGVMVIVSRRGGPDVWEFHGKGTPLTTDGSYAFEGLEPGLYRVSVIGFDSSIGSHNAPELELPEDGKAVQDFEVRPGGRLTVTVVDGDCEPVAGAVVGAFDEQRRELPYHPDPLTDVDGRGDIASLAAGRWTLTVEKAGHVRVRRALDVAVGQALVETVVLRRLP